MIMLFYNLIIRDLKLAFYSSANFLLAASFLILILVLIPFVFNASPDSFTLLFSGFIWIAIALSILLTLDRVFNSDYEDGNLEIILISQFPIELIVCAKFISHWISNCIPIIIAIPIAGLLFNISLSDNLYIVVNIIAGSPGMVFIGAAISALTLGSKRASLYKTIIVIPLYIPFMIFGVNQESSLVLLGLSMISFIFSLFTSTYSLRLYAE
jgi:heme exporter protein B